MRRFHAAVVAIFIAVITLPLAANLTGHDGADAGAENRQLATRADGLDKWFEDHFGFRAMLVRWYGLSRLELLHTAPTSRVARGRDDWFFYMEDESVEDYAQATPLTPVALRNWREELTRAQAWLSGQGIAFVFTIAPDKHMIYPEEMPAALNRVGAISHTDQVFDALSHTGVAAVDPFLPSFPQKAELFGFVLLGLFHQPQGLADDLAGVAILARGHLASHEFLPRLRQRDIHGRRIARYH